ncbi:hypothetical protein KCU64_g21, partial [Aureobasidium melanogenum]
LIWLWEGEYLPTDTLPYTIECNACGSRFNRMIDWEEHEPIHDVVSDVERPDGSEEPLVFHFDTLGVFPATASQPGAD